LKRKPVAAVLGAAALLVLAACGSSGSEESSDGADGATPTIRVGTIATSGLAILHVMQSKPGDLSLSEGTAYQTKFNAFAGSPDILQGLATGTLDAGAVGAVGLFPALKQGVDLKITGELFEEKAGNLSTTWLVKNDSPIKSAADFKGKTMASNSVGSPVYYIAKSYFADAGLTVDKDYKVVAVPFPNMTQALDSGQVDLAPVIMPQLAEALTSGKYRVLFKDTDVQNPYVQTLMVFRQSFIDEHPDAVKAFMADFGKSADYVNDPKNKTNVVASVSAVTKVPAASLDYFGTKDYYYVPPKGAPQAEAIQANWDWYKENGGVDKDYDVADYLDPSLLPK
jgi:ABC-type nitrate/sulfonate/bicarbonate transport system substrate-binding protein